MRSVDDNEKNNTADIQSFIEIARKRKKDITQEEAEVFCIIDDKPVSEKGNGSKDNTTKEENSQTKTRTSNKSRDSSLDEQDAELIAQRLKPN